MRWAIRCAANLLAVTHTTSRRGPALIAGFRAQQVLADKGYDSSPFIAEIEATGAQSVIPPRKKRREPRPYDRYPESVYELTYRPLHAGVGESELSGGHVVWPHNYLLACLPLHGHGLVADLKAALIYGKVAEHGPGPGLQQLLANLVGIETVRPARRFHEELSGRVGRWGEEGGRTVELCPDAQVRTGAATARRERQLFGNPRPGHVRKGPARTSLSVRALTYVGVRIFFLRNGCQHLLIKP